MATEQQERDTEDVQESSVAIATGDQSHIRFLAAIPEQKLVLKNFRPSDFYFIEDYYNAIWETLFPPRPGLLESMDDIEFTIYYENVQLADGNIIEAYGGIGSPVKITILEDREVGRLPTPTGIGSFQGKGNIEYASASEEERLKFLYGAVEPEIQITLDEAALPSSLFQNEIQTNEISYESISSMGAATQEELTVSATTGSVTGLITEQTETITDVGGVVARGRRTGGPETLTTTVTDSATGATTTYEVTTSGY